MTFNLKNHQITQKGKHGDIMKSLTIGFIRSDWISNEDGDDRIDVGDTEFSKTDEVTIQFTGDKFEYGGRSIEYQHVHNTPYQELKLLVKNLQKNKGWTTLTNKSLATAFWTIKGDYEPKKNDKIVKLVTSQGPEIIDATAYKGHFYMNLWDDDTEDEILVVFA